MGEVKKYRSKVICPYQKMWNTIFYPTLFEGSSFYLTESSNPALKLALREAEGCGRTFSLVPICHCERERSNLVKIATSPLDSCNDKVEEIMWRSANEL